jgi:fumarate reductase subunit C
MSGDLLYRRPVSVWWWIHKRSYFLFVMRELSSLFIAWLVLYLLLFVRAVTRGEAPTSSTGPPRPGWSRSTWSPSAS